MKLAEALLLRADLQKKQESLRERISKNVLIQEGTEPSENPKNLFIEANRVSSELELLVVAINKANLNNQLKDGKTLTASIAHRDTLLYRHSLLQKAINSSQELDRYSAREIKWVSIVSVVELQKQLDDISCQIRELNARIQETNWSVEL